MSPIHHVPGHARAAVCSLFDSGRLWGSFSKGSLRNETKTNERGESVLLLCQNRWKFAILQRTQRKIKGRVASPILSNAAQWYT